MKITPSLIALLSACAALVPSNAMAVIDTSMIISKLGVQDNKGYMMFQTGLSQSCSYQTVYIDLQSDGGKAMYATAMSAHLSARPLARVEYSIANGICNASLVEF